MNNCEFTLISITRICITQNIILKYFIVSSKQNSKRCKTVAFMSRVFCFCKQLQHKMKAPLYCLYFLPLVFVKSIKAIQFLKFGCYWNSQIATRVVLHLEDLVGIRNERTVTPLLAVFGNNASLCVDSRDLTALRYLVKWGHYGYNFSRIYEQVRILIQD